MDLNTKTKNIELSNSTSEEMIDFRVNKPYPPIRVLEENIRYAKLLLNDFSGVVSEFSAITQYVNHEIKISTLNPKTSVTIKGIAMVEMHHLQMIGQLITLLGCDPNYEIIKKNKPLNWSPKFINYGSSINNMINFDIEGEVQAIAQYKKHIQEIDDPFIDAILRRIILDEEKHIEVLTSLLN